MFLTLKLSDVVFIPLINVNMQAIVVILIFMSRIKLSVELSMKKSFYNLGSRPVQVLILSDKAFYESKT